MERLSNAPRASYYVSITELRIHLIILVISLQSSKYPFLNSSLVRGSVPLTEADWLLEQASLCRSIIEVARAQKT